eukprot:COSAG06_NODE_24_length_32981_cov_25.509671_4_plen_71_part_00
MGGAVCSCSNSTRDGHHRKHWCARQAGRRAETERELEHRHTLEETRVPFTESLLSVRRSFMSQQSGHRDA